MDFYYGIIASLYILAIIAVHISFKNWVRWKEIELDTIKARAFLDKSFLINNFNLMFISIGILVGLASTYLLVEYAGLRGDLSFSLRTNLVYYSVLPVAMLSLVLLAYAHIWYKLLYKDSKI